MFIVNLVKKSKLALMFVLNDSFAFAAANVIRTFEFWHPNVEVEYVIFCENLVEENKLALTLMTKRKIVFKEFSQEYLQCRCPKLPMDAPCIKKWSILHLAKFEIFDLLNTYESVLFLDADTHFVGSIDNVLKKKVGIAWRASAADFHGFVSNFEKVPLEYTMPNGGFIYVDDSLSGYENLTETCYKLENESYGITRSDKGQDEIIFGLINYKYKLNVHLLPMAYNCPLGGKQTNKALLLHFMGNIAKIWKNNLLINFFPDFKKNYNDFIKFGGLPYSGEINTSNGNFSKNYGLLQAYNVVRYITIWSNLLGNETLHKGLPENIYSTYIYSRKFIPFYFKNLTKKIHYELIYVEGKDNIKTMAFHIEDETTIKCQTKIESIKKIFSIYSFDFSQESTKVSFEKNVKNDIVIDLFLQFMKATSLVFEKILRE